jgi:hypothetical protein
MIRRIPQVRELPRGSLGLGCNVLWDKEVPSLEFDRKNQVVRILPGC